jgi:hypothetical protein
MRYLILGNRFLKKKHLLPSNTNTHYIDIWNFILNCLAQELLLRNKNLFFLFAMKVVVVVVVVTNIKEKIKHQHQVIT